MEIVGFSFVSSGDSDQLGAYVSYDDFVEEQIDFFKKVYPVRDENLFVVRPESNPIYMNSELKINLTKGQLCDLPRYLSTLNVLASMNLTKLIAVVSNNTASVYLRNAENIPTAGYRCTGDWWHVVVTEQIDSEDIQKSTTTAHEIGHTYDACDEYSELTFLKQANSSSRTNDCINGDIDPKDKQLDSECINTYGVTGLMGCPILDQEVIRDLYYPGTNYNLVNMYGSRLRPDSRRWIDNTTYQNLFDIFSSQQSEVICTDDEILVVTGIVNKSFYLNMADFYIVKGGCYVEETVNSPPVFGIRITQKSGGVIKNTILKLIDFVIPGDGGDVIELDEMPFVITMPYDGNTTVIEFINEATNATLTNRSVTANSPKVNITSLNSGIIYQSPFNLSWNASDLDGDNMSYAILLSYDGGNNYFTIDFDVNNTYYEINPDLFDYSENAVFKVLATDGVNTGNNVSNSITLGTPLYISSFKEIFRNGVNKVWEARIQNRGSLPINNVNWTFNPGDNNTVVSAKLANLSSNQTMKVVIEHNYSALGTYDVYFNVTNGTVHDEASIINKDIVITAFKEIESNYKRKVFHAQILNNASTNHTVNWTFNTGESTIQSNPTIQMLPFTKANIIIEYNYTNATTKTATFNATDANAKDSKTITVTFETKLNLDLTLLNSTGVYQILVQNIDTANQTFNWTLNTTTLIQSAQNVTLNPNQIFRGIIKNNQTPGTYNTTAIVQTNQDTYTKTIKATIT